MLSAAGVGVDRRSSLKTLLVAACLLSFAGVASAQEHFDPKSKAPSEHTPAVRAENAANLPFQDERDVEEAAHPSPSIT